MATTRLTGRAAIEAAEADAAVILCSYTDPTEEGREGLTVDEAREIAREDPALVYAIVPTPPQASVATTTIKPVTTAGWYERTDGTVAYYSLLEPGRPREGRVVASWADVETPEEMAAARAAVPARQDR